MANPVVDTRPASIMVVDDDQCILAVLKAILCDHGYAVRILTDGRQVLESAQTDPPDLILLDIRLPDIEGYDVCAALKADLRTQDIPVIFVSALKESFDKL